MAECIPQLVKCTFWLFCIVVIVVPRILDLNVFYARDELTIWSWSDQFIKAVWRGDAAATLTNSDYPGIPVFWAQAAFLAFKHSFPSLFPQAMVSLDQLPANRDIELLAEQRLMVGLLVSLQLLVVVWLTRRIWGQHIAILSAILLGLDPFSLSESRVLRLEMVSAGFVTLSLLGFLSYRQTRQHRWTIFSGIMAGLAVSSKTSAGLVVPCIWLLLLLEFVSGRVSRHVYNFRSTILAGLLWALGAVFIFWVVWPAMWVQPLAALEHLWRTGFAQAADRSVWGNIVFFWGQTIEGGDPGPWFYPVALAFRTTPLVWLGVALVFAHLLQSVLKTPKTLISSPAFSLLFSIAMLLIELTLIISKVDRFMVIFFPALNILAAIGLGSIGKALERKFTRFFKAHSVLAVSGVALFSALQLTQTLPAHPYYFTYWNPLLGGGRMAMNILPIGAGEGIDLAMEYLNSQPDVEALTVVCGGSKPWCEHTFKGRTLRFATYASGEWFAADYATFYISHLQRGRYPKHIVDFFMRQEPVYRVELNGATYVWVFRVPKVEHFAGPWNELAGQARLLGFDLGESSRAAGDVVKAKVWWENRGAGVDRLVLRLIDRRGYEWTRARLSPLPEFADTPPEQVSIVAGETAVQLPPSMPPGRYFWRIGVTSRDDTRLVGEFSLPAQADKLVITSTPLLSEPSQFDIAVRLDDQLAPEVKLLGYTLSGQLINAETPIYLILYWQAVGIPQDYQVVLRLVNESGKEVAQWRGRPAYNEYPMNHWSPGQIVQDIWPLQVDPQTIPGKYTLLVSLSGTDESTNTQQLSFANRFSSIPDLQVWPHPVNFDIPNMQFEINARFGSKLAMLGYDLYFETDGSNTGALLPTFYWQSQASFEGTFNLRLNLWEADTGQRLAEWNVALGNKEAKTVWQEREVIATPYRFELNALPGRRYHLDIALFEIGTAQPLTVMDPNGRESTFLRLENIQDKIVVLLK